MLKKWTLISIGLIITIFALAAVACEEETSPEEAKAQLCQDLAELDSALAALENIGPDSTVADLEAASDSVEDALAKVSDSAEKAGEVRVSDLEGAYDDLDQAVADIPDDATVSEGLAAIEGELAAVDAAWAQLFATLDCP